MSDQRRLEAALDVRVTSESHQSMADFLKKVEAAEASARRMRESLNGGGMPGAGGGASGSPFVGGSTHSWTPSTGFVPPGGGYGAPSSIHQNINDYAQKMDRVEQQSRRIRDNLNTVPGTVSGHGAFYRPSPNEHAQTYRGGAGPMPTPFPFPGSVDPGFWRSTATPTRIPFPGEVASAGGNWDARNSRWDLPEHLQTMNKFGDRTIPRQWGQTLMSGATSAITGLGGIATGAGLKWGLPLLAGAAAMGGWANSVYSAELVGNTGGTTGEQARALADGNFITRQGLGIVDAFRGRSQDIALQQYKNQFGMVDASSQEQIRQFKNEIERGRYPLERERDVRDRDTRFAALGQFNLRTVGGEIEQREAQRLIPVERERFERERVLQVERGVQSDLEGKLGRLQREVIEGANQGGRMNIFNGDLRREGAAGLADISKWEQLSVKQRGLLAEIKEVAQAVEGQKGRVIEATANLNRVGVEELRARAGIAETRLVTAKGQAQRIGSMNPADLAQSQAAFMTIQQAGTLDGFPQELIQRAAQFDPATIEKLQENRGIQRIDTMGLARDKVGSFRDQVPAAEEDYRRLTNAAEEAGVKIGQAAARMAADMLKSPEFLKTITDAIKNEGELQKNEIKAQQGVQNIKGG